jgi:hypothetical protein
MCQCLLSHLRIAHVPVQDVQLGVRDRVDDLCYHRYWLEVSTRIDHEPSVGEARIVLVVVNKCRELEVQV